MEFKVDGVDMKTGRDVKPLIVEADDDAGATAEARRKGVLPTNVKQYMPPLTVEQPTVVQRVHFRSAAPTVLGVLGTIFWLVALGAFYGDDIAAMITAAACGICGSIFFVGAAITRGIDRLRRHE